MAVVAAWVCSEVMSVGAWVWFWLPLLQQGRCIQKATVSKTDRRVQVRKELAVRKKMAGESM